MKSTLFPTAGAIIYKTGNARSATWGHWLSNACHPHLFYRGFLAMIGIPPQRIYQQAGPSMGALDAGKPAFVFLLILSSLMNGIYYLPIIISAFFGVEREKRTWGRPLQN